MRATNSLETYGFIHQMLHWATALLILLLLPLGIYMHDLPLITPSDVETKVWFYSLHKTLGMLAFLVAVLRIIWAIIQPHPRPLHGGVEAFAAATVHWVLYGAIFLMPLLGWFHHAASTGFAPIWWPFSQDLFFIQKDPDLSHIFNVAHRVAGFTLVGALFLHIAGALKHVMIDKDKTLSRMVPNAYQETGNIPPRQPVKLSILAAFAILLLGTGATIGVNAYETALKAPQVAQLDETSIQNANEINQRAWVIDHSQSTLGLEITQLGSPVSGRFDQWSAIVEFDPDDLDNATIFAEVTIPSLVLGEISERALSAEFLSSDLHAKAEFTADSIISKGDGYVAQGRLTLAGISQDFAIDFTFEERDGRAFVTGRADIQRLDFGIGKDFTDDSSVGRVVRLLINIEAKRP